MRLEHIVFASIIGVVALLVVLLNDKSKPREVVKKQQSNWHISPLGIVVSIIVFAGAIATGLLFANDRPYLAWAIPIGLLLVFVLVFIGTAFGKLMWLYMSATFFGGQMPILLRKDKDGIIRLNCPSCSKQVTLEVGKKGESAFQCENCGEKGTWTTDNKQ